MPTTTEQRVTEAADALRKAVASYNAAVEDAARLGLRVELRTMRMQMIGAADFDLLSVQIYEPR